MASGRRRLLVSRPAALRLSTELRAGAFIALGAPRLRASKVARRLSEALVAGVLRALAARESSMAAALAAGTAAATAERINGDQTMMRSSRSAGGLRRERRQPGPDRFEKKLVRFRGDVLHRGRVGQQQPGAAHDLGLARNVRQVQFAEDFHGRERLRLAQAGAQIGQAAICPARPRPRPRCARR